MLYKNTIQHIFKFLGPTRTIHRLDGRWFSKMRSVDYNGNITDGCTSVQITKYGPEWLSKEMIVRW